MKNAWIHRLMSKLLGYPILVLWMPRKSQSIADALSSSVFDAEEKPDILICTMHACLASQDGQLNRNKEGTENVNDLAMAELMTHAKADQDYQKILDAVHSLNNYQKTILLSHTAVIGMRCLLNLNYQN